jgi:hypothetical protein
MVIPLYGIHSAAGGVGERRPRGVGERRTGRYNLLSSVQDNLPDKPAAQPATQQSETEPMLYCPVCSTRLAERKCKLLCEKCGYYMSCADYY